MKKIIFLFTFLNVMTSIFAQTETDGLSNLYHSRIIERYSEIEFGEFIGLENPDVPDQVQELKQRQYSDMLHFAEAYNLFQLGWSYQNHPTTYAITNIEGEVIGFTFSIVISKNLKPKSRRFYQASKRVDGFFFVERISDYDL